MVLQAKFRAAGTSKIIPLELLKTGNENSITQAWRTAGIVMFVLRDINDYINSEQIISLPFDCAVMISDYDIKVINEDHVWLNLMYKTKRNIGNWINYNYMKQLNMYNYD
jgi:hypothetical protein